MKTVPVLWLSLALPLVAAPIREPFYQILRPHCSGDYTCNSSDSFEIPEGYIAYIDYITFSTQFESDAEVINELDETVNLQHDATFEARLDVVTGSQSWNMWCYETRSESVSVPPGANFSFGITINCDDSFSERTRVYGWVGADVYGFGERTINREDIIYPPFSDTDIPYLTGEIGIDLIPTPEPTSMGLIGLSLAGLAAKIWRRNGS